MPGEQLAEIRGVVLRLTLGEGAPEHADQCGTLEQRQVGRRRRNVATGGETHHQHAAVPGDAAERFLEQLTAYRIVDDIHTLAAGEFLQALLQADFAVVDQFVGAGILRHLQLFGAGGGGDDSRAHGLADLHGSQADASGGTEHQQGLAGLQIGALLERMHRGAVGHAEGGGGVEVHARRNRQRVAAGHGNLLGEAAPASERHAPVADLEVADLLSDCGNHARRLAARRERERRLELILALDHQRVREIHPGGMHVEQDLARLDLRGGGIFDNQAFGRAEAFAQDGFHRFSLFDWSDACRPTWDGSTAQDFPV